MSKKEKLFQNKSKRQCLFWDTLSLYGFLKEENIIKCRSPPPGTLLLFRSYLLFSSDSAQIEWGGGLRSTMLYDAIYEKTFAYLFFSHSLFLSPACVCVCGSEWVSVCVCGWLGECVWIIDVVLQDHLMEIFLLGAVRISPKTNFSLLFFSPVFISLFSSLPAHTEASTIFPFLQIR